MTGRNRQETNKQQAGDRQNVQGEARERDRRQTIYKQKTGGMIQGTGRNGQEEVGLRSQKETEGSRSQERDWQKWGGGDRRNRRQERRQGAVR